MESSVSKRSNTQPPNRRNDLACLLDLTCLATQLNEQVISAAKRRNLHCCDRPGLDTAFWRFYFLRSLNNPSSCLVYKIVYNDGRANQTLVERIYLWIMTMATNTPAFCGIGICFWITTLSLLNQLMAAETSRMVRLKYEHPGLVVDLGVGLWASPLPMDYDLDGDLDLIVSCSDVPYNGTYFFENPGTIGDGDRLAVFEPAVRIGNGYDNIQVSDVEGHPRVLTPATEFQHFLKRQFAEARTLPISPDFHGGKLVSNQSNQWKYCDYDGDADLDLVIGIEDWADYGWDNAFNKEGEWTNGPLHGYVYLARNVGTNEQPEYELPVKLRAGQKEIDVYGRPSPNFADFDGDGDLDLLCGEFIDRFTYFENVGSRQKPKYREGRTLTRDGQVLRADLCMIVPVADDWNGDGHFDLVVGQEDGRVMLIRHTGRVVDGMPQFETPQYFLQKADDLKFGALATPVGFDWDNDGDEDILCGNTAGEIGWLENLNGADPPRWAAPKLIEAGGKTIRIQAGPNGSIQGPCETKWGYTTFSIADWDQDGLPDLVVNSIWGKVHWYRNIGSRTSPRFASAAAIEVEWADGNQKPAWVWWAPQGNELVTQWRTTPFAIDFNGDGLTDLVMLDYDGFLTLYPRKRRNGQLILLPPERVIVDDTLKPFRLTEGAAGASGRRKFCLADWDGDGNLDLFVNAANVQYFRGEGWHDGKYQFRDRGPVDSRQLAGHDTSPTTVDWDRNGIRDLVIGAEDGCFYYLRNGQVSKDSRSR